MAELNIKIGSEVSGALSGLQRVQTQMQNTAKASQVFTQSLNKVPQVSNAATQSLVNLSRVAQDAPFGFLGIANNLNPLLESFQRLKVQTGTTGGALKALGKELTGAGGIGLALGVASSLLVVFGDKIFGAGKAAKDAAEKVDSLKKATEGFFSEAAKEAATVNTLITVLKAETETRERKLSAIKELQKIQPEVFAQIKLEGDAVAGLDAAYQSYIANLRNTITLKIKQFQLETLIQKQLELQGVTLTKTQSESVEALKQINKNLGFDPSKLEFNQKSAAKRASELNDNLKNQAALIKEIGDLSSSYKLPVIKDAKLKIKKVDFEIERAGFTVRQFDVIVREEAGNGFSETVNNLFDKAQSSIKNRKPLDVSSLFDGFKVAQEETKKLLDNAINSANIISGTLAPAFEGLFSTISEGGNALKGFFEGLKNSIQQLIQKLIGAAVQAAILSALTQGTGNPLSFLGAFKSVLGFRASGGPVNQNSPYVVGERGPELFVPSVSGNIVPNNRMGGVSAPGINMGGGEVVFRIGGNELVGVLTRTNQSQRRLG